MHYLVKPSALGSGKLRVPGDKSISHRALLLGSLADGITTVSGFLTGEDCLATMSALRAMGVEIEHDGDSNLRICGVGLRGLSAPPHPLDLGNSGTAMRLFCGLLAGQHFDSELTGDRSLSARPMARVVEPLQQMGASIESTQGHAPLRIRGGRQLRGIDYALPVASAQLKSALLLAGLYAEETTVVREPAVTRDHSERMMLAMGAEISSKRGVIRLQPGRPLHGIHIDVPADLSSATFMMLAALLAHDCKLVLQDVGLNPTRDGVLKILRAMGADFSIRGQRRYGAEPVGDLEVRSAGLHGVKVDPALVPLAIDEFPALFVAAACAEGTTEFRGLAELRVKESDRLAVMAAGLVALGISVDESDDGARIAGGSLRGGTVDSHGDHRVAMAFAVAATTADGPVLIRDVDNVATSYPGFERALQQLGVDISKVAEPGL